MAKLYWRVKKNGRWTWLPAKVVHQEWTADSKLLRTDIVCWTEYIDNVPGKEEEQE